MSYLKNVSIDSYSDKIGEAILNWSLGRERILNIISVPYNSPVILLKLILKYISSGKNIMYITGEMENRVGIVENLKKYTNFRDYEYVRNINQDMTSSLILCTPVKAAFINKTFDLYIYDDIGSMSESCNYKTLEYLLETSDPSSKIICCSPECVFNGEREIIIPVKDNRYPIIEPRIMVTKLDLNKDIPVTAFDYIEWSLNSGRKVILYVPDSIKVKNVSHYLSKCLGSQRKFVFTYIKDESAIKDAANFLQMKKAVLVTDEYGEIFSDARETDIMVCFAEHENFNYRRLLYFCSRVGRRETDKRGEVVLLASMETYDMEKAKIVTRNFNKEAWEAGLLRT